MRMSLSFSRQPVLTLTQATSFLFPAFERAKIQVQAAGVLSLTLWGRILSLARYLDCDRRSARESANELEEVNLALGWLTRHAHI